ncbi:MAG: murein biosynthesis integral membrane protein MurJ [Myxococcota bacterium]
MTDPDTSAAEPARESIARRAGLIALGTLASRLLGLLRDRVIASTFAVGATDAFWLAFTIPNALRVLLAEGATSGAFVPVLTDVREKRGQEAASRVFAKLAGAMVLLLLVVAAIGSFAAPLLVRLYASGFEAGRYDEAVRLTRVVFPYVALVGSAAMVMGALHTAKRFAVAAFAPAMLNVALIAACLFFASEGAGTMVLAIGALIGGALHLLVQLPSLRRASYSLRPRLDLKDPDVRRAFRLLLPLLIALGVYQLNIVASRQLASHLGEGAISYLFYGQRLVEIPQGVFALAIGSAALPNLAEYAARNDLEGAKALFRSSLCLTLFVAVPSAVGLAMLAEPLVDALLGAGEFGAHEISETARSLVFLAAGVWAVASVRTVVPMFHSLGDTRSPVVASAFNLVVFFGVSMLTMGTMGHAGLALAIALAAAVQLIVLLTMLRRRIGALRLGEVALRTLRFVLAAALMGGALYALRDFRGLAALALKVAVGAITYGAAAWVLRVPELRAVTNRLRRRRS